MTTGPTRGLWRRVLDMGVARGSFLASRAVMFIVFGLALEPATYGVIAVLLATAAAAMLLLDHGLGLLLARQAAVGERAATDALGGLVVLRALALAPVLVVYGVAAYLLLADRFDLALAAAVGVWTLLQPVAQTLYAFLRGTRRTAVEAVTTFALHALEVVLVVLWYWRGSTEPRGLFVLLAIARAAFTSALCAYVVVRFRSGMHPASAWQWLALHRHVAAALAVLAAMQFVLAQSDSLLLQVLAGPEEVGRYFAAYRVVWIGFIPNELLLAAALPRLATARNAVQLYDAFDGVHRLAVVLIVTVLAVGVVQREFVVDALLGPQSSSTPRLFALLVVAHAVAWLPPFGIGLAMHSDARAAANGYVVAAVVSVAANMLLIPRFGAEGAAIAMIMGYSVAKVAFVVLFRARGLPIAPWRTLGAVVAVSLVWALGTRAMGLAPMSATLVMALAGTVLLVIQARGSHALIEGPQ